MLYYVIEEGTGWYAPYAKIVTMEELESIERHSDFYVKKYSLEMNERILLKANRIFNKLKPGYGKQLCKVVLDGNVWDMTVMNNMGMKLLRLSPRTNGTGQKWNWTLCSKKQPGFLSVIKL